MSNAHVESKAMRTWERDEAPKPTKRWMLVAKAQFMRYQSNWLFWIIMAGAIAYTLAALLATMGTAYHGAIDSELLYGLGPGVGLVMITLLFLGAPAIADDLRFDATLYYFSRPLSVKDYLIGKAAFVTGVLLLVIMPAILMFSIASVSSWAAGEPDPPTHPGPFASEWEMQNYLQALDRHENNLIRFHATYMDHFGDWLLTVSVLIGGALISAFFLGAVANYLGSWTTRGWHAAIAVVVGIGGLGMLGAGLGYVMTNTAFALIFSVASWPYAATLLPLEAYYWDTSWSATPPRYLHGAAATAVLSWVFMAGTGIGLYALTYRRLLKLGGQA